MINETHSEENLVNWRDALAVECSLRPLRDLVVDAHSKIEPGTKSEALVSAQEVKAKAAGMLDTLEAAKFVVDAASASPCWEAAEIMVRDATREAFDAFEGNIEAAIIRHQSRATSNAALSSLADWFAETWISKRQTNISSSTQPLPGLVEILAALPTLGFYQRFRARATDLEPLALTILSLLRSSETALLAIPTDQIDIVVRGIIKREAYLAWAARLRDTNPSLLIERDETQQKIASLSKSDAELRDANRKLLAKDIDPKKLAAPSEWEGVTRLRGPRTKKLREIIAIGGELGLNHMRPIWLMTPDTVSRVLPFKAGQFDVVIFDEASQLLVEHAVPAMYRAKRVVVSGDEKQMPPTSFFSSRSGSDEDEEFDGAEPDDTATETERDIYEETWNRREIKDCPDLLALGHSFLPTTSLQIHYRSKYRDLITYSNAAFYKGSLSVPVHHPDAEIKRVQPIQVIRAQGVYEAQTNAVEAQLVVEQLAHLWAAPPTACPSIGVVTFNLKQADLVEDAIDKRANSDPAFNAAYQREKNRLQNAEDMGFFIKNVETVQGDERDVIIFSTTFGPDQRGSFRRNFGALGQVGGERRLNVAVTRAREKVIIVTSMPIKDISDALATGRTPSKPRDYIQGYLDFASKISAGDVSSARVSAERISSGRSNSVPDCNEADGFVRSVAAFLKDLGHDAMPADNGDAFGIDLAIENPGTGQFGLAIECDAPRDNDGRLPTARAREIWRPNVLRRAVPEVYRVSSQAWYFDGVAERARLRTVVDEALRKVQA